MLEKFHILVRQTNPQSIQWIGKDDDVAKPIDRKSTTATSTGRSRGRTVETAALVMTPHAARLRQGLSGKYMHGE